jgi:hypothetical protein
MREMSLMFIVRAKMADIVLKVEEDKLFHGPRGDIKICMEILTYPSS